MLKAPFKKILIANRGEIAVRIIRACAEMGITAVAVYSEVDRASEHVLMADEAYPIGPAASTESYLRIDKLIAVAQKSGAEALHPGYGFLAENAALARACREAGIVFIGPSAEAMELMGSKTESRRAAERAGAPFIPGLLEPLASPEEGQKLGAEWGYPVMLKAVAGGGGKGMRIIRTPEQWAGAWRDARSEAENAFGDPSLYVEKYLDRPRHVEIQVLGDHHGNLIHLGERECSMQRRHQKLVEECPSPIVTAARREAMGAAAVRIARAGGYTNAGTVEFLVVAAPESEFGYEFYFLEMNTRLQVEHPVTEVVTGLDLVKEQIRIAAGEKLAYRQEDIDWRGAAIECRLYAEDPENNFFPCPGRITRLERPAGPGVRVDGYVYEGWSVPMEYDPLLAKLVCWGSTRAEALARMRRALDEYQVGGIQTNLAFFRRLLQRPEFIRGELDTELIDRMLAEKAKAAPPDSVREAAAVASALSEMAATTNGLRPARQRL
ncbi:MAG TPA: acetyl-CoA carboxylase biotin carboxylase subunit, partial [Candidatus Acidoferrales bacterium]|nr:acetyl-CoA carboxylase biotin carboxylase subunit [Candidatus Acidoferrales bacterium]